MKWEHRNKMESVRNSYPLREHTENYDIADEYFGSECWCGKPFGHDWPGKSEGKSHPR